MDFDGLRLEYALEGSSNYISWKDRMDAVLKDNGLKEFIDKDVPKPDVVDVQILMHGKRKWKRRGGSCWREYETTLSQASMGKSHHLQCGRL
jgi:hypothetical protein